MGNERYSGPTVRGPRGRRMALAARLAVAATSLALAAGCMASSQYKPRPLGKVQLVVKNNQYLLYKDGETAAMPSEASAALFTCSGKAAEAAEQARSDFTTAQIWTLGGTLTGLIPALVGRKYRLDAIAETTDAMNIHNDTPDCLQSAASARAAQPASNGGVR